MDLKENLKLLEEHNHSKEPYLFLKPEDLEDRLEAIMSKVDGQLSLDEYNFRCVFTNLKVNGILYSITTTRDLDDNKHLVIISDNRSPQVKDHFSIDRFPLRYADVRRGNLAAQDWTRLLVTPASNKESKLFGYLPEGIAERFDGTDEDRDLYTSARDFVSDRWGVLKDIYIDLVTCYALASWVRELFPAVPILAATGKTGTGKSVLLLILEALGFLTVDLASITGPAIAYVDEIYHPFLLQDECQALNNFRNPDTAEKISLINSRYKHRAKRVKMSDGTKDQPRGIEVQRLYGFTALGGTEIPSALGIQDRAILQPSIYASPKSPLEDQVSLKLATVIRCRSLAFRARHLFDDFWPYRREFDEALQECTGRVREQAYCILYIAKICAEEKTYQNLLAFFRQLDKKKKNETAVGELADVITAYVKALEKNHESDQEFEFEFEFEMETEVYVGVCLSLFNEGKSEKDLMSSAKFGLKLKSLGFETYRDSVTGRKLVKYDADLLEKQVASYNIPLTLPLLGEKAN